jgi:hypothetical protein
MVFMALEDEDNTQLDSIKKNNEKSKKSLKTVLSRGKLDKREMDEMFLDY